MPSQVMCPHCRSFQTFRPKPSMPGDLAVILIVVSLGLALPIVLPWWLIEKAVKRNDPFYNYGYQCGNCAYRWVNK